MLCMWFMMSNVLLSMECFHSMSWRHLLPLYAVSSTSFPLEFLLYPMALMMPCLWCCGLLWLGSRLIETIVGCSVVVLSVCSSSWVFSRACRVWSACGMLNYVCVCVLKSLMEFFPMSMLTIGHLPPLWLSNRSWRSLNVLLCLDVRSFELCLHPHKRCLFLIDWLYLPHSIGS